MIRQRLDSPELAANAEEGIERSRKLFDASVAQSEESSVALYSLGSPELLAAATDEVIGVLAGWGVLGLHRDALEIGCGIGRLMVPLCSRLRSVVGTDVSPGMIAAARRRLEGCSNAQRPADDWPGSLGVRIGVDGPRLQRRHVSLPGAWRACAGRAPLSGNPPGAPARRRLRPLQLRLRTVSRGRQRRGAGARARRGTARSCAPTNRRSGSGTASAG